MLAISHIQKVAKEMDNDQHLTLPIDAVEKWAGRLKKALDLHREGLDSLKQEIRPGDSSADVLTFTV
jgi:hypothetical protein